MTFKPRPSKFPCADMIMGNQMIEVTNNMTLVVSKKTKTHTHKKKDRNGDTGNRTDIVIAWVISIYFLSTNRGG